MTARDRGDVTREVLRLAWPAVLSYVLHNAYRINDQFWVQALGGEAQAAVGAAFFVIIFNFAVLFLAAGGTLALVARATGAGDAARAASVIRHAILFACALSIVVGGTGFVFVEEIVAALGLAERPSALAVEYLGTLYVLFLPLALVPVLDNAFIGLGLTKVPLVLDLVSLALNYLLNPILIYGGTAVATLAAQGQSALPGAALADTLAVALGVEARGMHGAALATCLSRALSTGLGLAILRFGLHISLCGSFRPKLARIAAIARISAPVSTSIAVYAGVYLAIFSLVMAPFATEVKAGFALGFQVFEGVAFPCYLGISVAAASLVGRKLGARDPEGARAVLKSARAVGRSVALAMTFLFLVPSRFVVGWFTHDALVAAETLRYVTILAFSQYWVAVESVNEKVLLGSGHTRPILWIAVLGNVLRVPLAWSLATFCGLGAVGVWWAIATTTCLKAGLFWWRVERGDWVTHLDRSEVRGEEGDEPNAG